MKLPHQTKFRRNKLGPLTAQRSEDGMATIIFIALLAIMLILVTAESRALFQLHREVRFLEHQQINRLSQSQTNSVSAAKPDPR
jgi:hypothetical protein